MQKVFNLEFKWGVSKSILNKGREICTLYVNGKKIYTSVGHWIDAKGVIFAYWLENNFQNELKKLNPAYYPWLEIKDKYVVIDSNESFDKLVYMVEQMGYTLKMEYGTNNSRERALMVKHGE